VVNEVCEEPVEGLELLTVPLEEFEVGPGLLEVGSEVLFEVEEEVNEEAAGGTSLRSDFERRVKSQNVPDEALRFTSVHGAEAIPLKKTWRVDPNLQNPACDD
jgi:hypothetical protein